ncbi:MAG: hypothetical protein IJ068_07720 [Bacilli bacterium]|nr:hypothetical protein [Bacilli bacterium]
MNLVLDLFTKREIIIIGAVIGTLILIVLIMTLIDVLSKRKKENDELEMAFDDLDIVPIKIDKSVSDVKETEKIEETKELDVQEVEIPNDLDKSEQVNINLVSEEKDEIKNIVQVEENVKKVNYIEPIIIDDFEEDKVVEQIDSKTVAQIELTELEKKLENPKSLEDTLYDLEIEEEENAIISYQELLETTRELNVIPTDSGDEIISLKEMINMYEITDNDNCESEDISEEMTKVSLNDAYKGDFTSTPILSPIMGFESDKEKAVDLAEIQLENTANLEKLDKELRKTNQFLSILNDLKKNLD